MTLPIDDDLYVTGKTGLGIQQPQERLEVNGKIKTTDLQASGTVQALSFQGDGSNLTGVIKNLDSVVKKAGDTMAGALTVQNNLTVTGNIGIGTSSPDYKLDVRGNDGWIGSGDSSQSQGGWRLGRWPYYSPNEWVYLVRADSTKYQDLAVGALWAGGALRFGSADDLAEMTPVKAEDYLKPGDVVVIENPPDNRVLLAKSNKPDDSKVAGVISDPSTAGLIIGGSHPTDVNRDDLKPLALAGRVLTKVTTENGLINAGDFLTTSSTPGCAMKANIPGYTLGKALQCFNGNENGESIGKIWVLVNLGWVGGVTNG